MQKGIITIEIDGISTEDTKRYQQMIHTFFEQGVFSILNGSANIHFRGGNLEAIDLNLYTYKRNKDNLPLQIEKNVVKTVKDLHESTFVV